MTTPRTQWLRFWSTDTLDSTVVRDVLETTARSRSWTLGAPTWRIDDGHLEGELELHCAYPPWGDQLPFEVDALELEQTKALVDALERLTRRLQVRVDVGLDSDELGTIENGVADAGVRETLIAEWERAHHARAPKEGILGDPIVLSTRDGRVLAPKDECSDPKTNAFLVWVGLTVLVVSSGVRAESDALVAERLREDLRLPPNLPVVFAQGRSGSGAVFVIRVHNPARAPARELARAEAYVLVQASWYEEERLVVAIGDEHHSFRVSLAVSGSPRIDSLEMECEPASENDV